MQMMAVVGIQPPRTVTPGDPWQRLLARAAMLDHDPRTADDPRERDEDPRDRDVRERDSTDPHLEQALKDGRGRIESVVLPHQYRHLSLLVALEDRRTRGAEEGEMTTSRPRPHSSAASTLTASVVRQGVHAPT